MYEDYNDLNSRLVALYASKLGTDKDISKAWNYFSKKHTPGDCRDKEFFLFLRSGAFSTSEKKYILNIIEQDEAIICQMDEDQLYALGMHFCYGIQKSKDGYATFTNLQWDQGNFSQELSPKKTTSRLSNI
jgi:hypothetical protein